MVNLLPFTKSGQTSGGSSGPQGGGPTGGSAGPQKSGGGGGGALAGLAGLAGRGGSKAAQVASPSRLSPGEQLPHITLHTVQGGRIEVGAPTGKWQLVVVYRGKHCPVSKNYLASLQQIIYELDELGVEVVAVSGDGRERAEAFLEVLKATTETKEITYKVAYGLPLHEQFRWGLYVSKPRNFRETELPFPEPALFLLNPDGELQIVDYSNSPFARPDLRILVEGIRYIQENDYPVRGMFGLRDAANQYQGRY